MIRWWPMSSNGSDDTDSLTLSIDTSPDWNVADFHVSRIVVNSMLPGVENSHTNYTHTHVRLCVRSHPFECVCVCVCGNVDINLSLHAHSVYHTQMGWLQRSTTTSHPPSYTHVYTNTNTHICTWVHVDNAANCMPTVESDFRCCRRRCRRRRCRRDRRRSACYPMCWGPKHIAHDPLRILLTLSAISCTHR